MNWRQILAEKYQFTDNAKKQLKENFKYYNDKNPNAADEFIVEVYEKCAPSARCRNAHIN